MPGLSRAWRLVRRHPVIAWTAVGATTCAALLVLVPIAQLEERKWLFANGTAAR